MLYVAATVNNTFGYYDPLYLYKGSLVYQFYNKDYCAEADKGIVYSDYLFSKETRDRASYIADAWFDTPVLSLVVTPGAYFWLDLILITLLNRKRRYKETLLFNIPALRWLICFASPVNGYLRYVLPIMASTPLYMMITFMALFDEYKKER